MSIYVAKKQMASLNMNKFQPAGIEVSLAETVMWHYFKKILLPNPMVDNRLCSCSQLVSRWANSGRGRGRDRGHTIQLQISIKIPNTYSVNIIHTTSLHSAFIIIPIIGLSSRPSNEDEEYRRMRDRYEEEWSGDQNQPLPISRSLLIQCNPLVSDRSLHHMRSQSKPCQVSSHDQM